MKQSTGENDIIRWAVVFGDIVLLNVILLAFLWLWPDIVPPYFHRCTKMTALCFNFALFACEYLFQPIIHKRTVRTEDVLLQVFQIVAVHSLLAFVMVRMLCDGGGFFRFLFIFAFAEYLLIAGTRIVERRLIGRYRLSGRNTRNVLFVGNDMANLQLYGKLLANPATGYRVIGYYSDEPFGEVPVATAYGGLKHLGSQGDLLKAFDSQLSTVTQADEIFCSLSHDESETIIRIMKFCDEHIIHFYYVPRMFGNFRLQLKPELFGDIMLFTNHREPLTRSANRFVKRSFDIVVSAGVCLILLPFIPILALIIKWQSPGPVFFTQERTGLNGKTFRCYKFRSMHVNNSSDQQQATASDPRKFAFGNFMRKTNIDEFPQFFNVLLGDMSIVGPRPHMLHHTEVYSRLIDKYMVRHFYKPGITGYAQITGFRGETRELWQMEERIRRDIWYIENWTFWLDLRIILRTAMTLVVHDKNAY